MGKGIIYRDQKFFKNGEGGRGGAEPEFFENYLEMTISPTKIGEGTDPPLIMGSIVSCLGPFSLYFLIALPDFVKPTLVQFGPT